MISQPKPHGHFAEGATTGARISWSPMIVLGLLSGWAAATSAGSVGPALRECGPLIVTQLPAGSAIERQPSASAGTVPLPYGDGSRLLLVRADGTLRVLSEGFQSAADPDISFDGQRILFAGKRSVQDRWKIYEMSTNGDDVRQVTQGLGDCRRPRYLSTLYEIASPQPWYQITYVGTDEEQLNEFGSGRATHLFSCKLDGSELTRLTDNLSSDWDPWLMQDGRLLFATWQRCGLEHGITGRVRLAAINIDGTDLAAFVGAGGKRVQHMACTTTSGLVVFVESDQVPWDGAGRLARVALRRPLHSYRGLTGAADGLFHSPSPISEGKILISHRPADGSGTHGVCRFDPDTRELLRVFDDPAYHEMQARQVSPRPEPDGRSSSVVNREGSVATLYCLDVYQSDLPRSDWLRPGTARRLRVLEGTPRRAGAESPSRVQIPQLASRRVLGEVEIAADGSFQVEVPANTPIQLQVLDKEGMALRSCGWIWAKNHEPRGCIGCHEDGERTPDNWLVEAVTHPAASACPPSGDQAAIGFRRDIMPLVSARCIGCHATGGAVPDLAGEGAARDSQAQHVYRTLLATDSADGDSADGDSVSAGPYVHMGQARTSPLVWHLFGRNMSRAWDGPSTGRPAKPLPPDSSVIVTAAERRTIIEWIDRGAHWEDAPSPPRVGKQ